MQESSGVAGTPILHLLVVASDGGSIAAGFLVGRQQYIRKAMKVKVGTLSLNVLESGAREPTLLFHHYWGGSARAWKPRYRKA
jgi:hypothetical protein